MAGSRRLDDGKEIEGINWQTEAGGGCSRRKLVKLTRRLGRRIITVTLLLLLRLLLLLDHRLLPGPVFFEYTKNSNINELFERLLRLNLILN